MHVHTHAHTHMHIHTLTHAHMHVTHHTIHIHANTGYVPCCRSIPIPVTQLQEEKANLELTLRQVLENIKLMLKEVDEHRERANQNEMLLQREKE